MTSAADNLSKLFPIDRAVSQNKSSVAMESGGVHVRFAAAAWNYGLLLPMNKIALEGANLADRQAVVKGMFHCISGNLEAALVGPNFSQILDVAEITPSDESAEINLLATRLGDVGGMVLRTLGPATSLCDVLVQKISVSLLDGSTGAGAFEPVGLRLLRAWSNYYGQRADTITEKLRAAAYNDLRVPIAIPWVDGLQLRLQPNNDMCRAIAVSGLYEPRIMLALQAALPMGGTFIDVGANMGTLAVFGARCVGAAGSVHAFEPSPRDFNRLTDNIALNDLARVVTANEIAIGDKSGTARLHIADERRSGLNTLAREFAYDAEEVAVIEVPMVSLDQYVAERKIDRIDLIKLDIEGAELFALKGAHEVLSRLKPDLIFEVLPKALLAFGDSVNELEVFLKSFGYSFFDLLEDKLAPQPIKNLAALKSDTVLAESRL